MEQSTKDTCAHQGKLLALERVPFLIYYEGNKGYSGWICGSLTNIHNSSLTIPDLGIIELIYNFNLKKWNRENLYSKSSAAGLILLYCVTRAVLSAV